MTALPTDVDVLEALASAATPGPFRSCDASEGQCKCGLVWSLSIDDVMCGPVYGGDTNITDNAANNAKFIATALNAVPGLIAEIRALRAKVAELEGK